MDRLGNERDPVQPQGDHHDLMSRAKMWFPQSKDYDSVQSNQRLQVHTTVTSPELHFQLMR